MGSKSGPMIGRGGAQDALSPVMAVVAASHRGDVASLRQARHETRGT
jgi:hypothetical protein